MRIDADLYYEISQYSHCRSIGAFCKSTSHIASTNKSGDSCDCYPQNISRNWSGYATTDGTFTGVRGSWTIPQSRGNNTYGIDATWVGIGGVRSDDLIQVGTQTAVDENGAVTYEAFFETLPDASHPLSLSVHGGDAITASVMKDASGKWNISLNDVTTHAGTQFSIPYDSSLSSAEWIEEAPSGVRNVLPLDNFGTIQFHNATVVQNGNTVTLSQAHANVMHMGSEGGDILATASEIGTDGTSFSVTRTSSSADSAAAVYRLRLHRLSRLPFVSQGL